MNNPIKKKAKDRLRKNRGVFPNFVKCGDVSESVSGLLLRDYFAAQALVGLFAQSAHPESPGIGESDYDDSACHAYRIADAMLIQREAEDG